MTPELVGIPWFCPYQPCDLGQVTAHWSLSMSLKLGALQPLSWHAVGPREQRRLVNLDRAGMHLCKQPRGPCHSLALLTSDLDEEKGPRQRTHR